MAATKARKPKTPEELLLEEQQQAQQRPPFTASDFAAATAGQRQDRSPVGATVRLAQQSGNYQMADRVRTAAAQDPEQMLAAESRVQSPAPEPTTSPKPEVPAQTQPGLGPAEPQRDDGATLESRRQRLLQIDTDLRRQIESADRMGIRPGDPQREELILARQRNTDELRQLQTASAQVNQPRFIGAGDVAAGRQDLSRQGVANAEAEIQRITKAISTATPDQRVQLQQQLEEAHQIRDNFRRQGEAVNSPDAAPGQAEAAQRGNLARIDQYQRQTSRRDMARGRSLDAEELYMEELGRGRELESAGYDAALAQTKAVGQEAAARGNAAEFASDPSTLQINQEISRMDAENRRDEIKARMGEWQARVRDLEQTGQYASPDLDRSVQDFIASIQQNDGTGTFGANSELLVGNLQRSATAIREKLSKMDPKAQAFWKSKISVMLMDADVRGVGGAWSWLRRNVIGSGDVTRNTRSAHEAIRSVLDAVK
jgi:hypothetical protein